MPTATEQLLKDHQMIRKLLEGFTLENPRFPHILQTLDRVVRAHAWFEDQFLLPALEGDPLLEKNFLGEIAHEHKDIEFFLTRLRKKPNAPIDLRAAWVQQLCVILQSHFEKEEKALFPLAEKILKTDGLHALAREMDQHKSAVQPRP